MPKATVCLCMHPNCKHIEISYNSEKQAQIFMDTHSLKNHCVEGSTACNPLYETYSLEALGFSPDAIEQIRQLFKQLHGKDRVEFFNRVRESLYRSAYRVKFKPAVAAAKISDM